MKQVATDVVRRLGLNYVVTMVSQGESGNCEIVMWDKPLNSYFSVRLRRCAETSVGGLEQEIESQLRHRLAVLSSGALKGLADRRPRRSSIPAARTASP